MPDGPFQALVGSERTKIWTSPPHGLGGEFLTRWGAFDWKEKNFKRKGAKFGLGWMQIPQ